MRIGLLLCDDVKPDLQTAHRNYPDMFDTTLRKVDPSLSLRCYRVMDGEYPEDIDECDGYVISGSRYSVYDDLPWIKQFESFVKTLYEKGKPTVGICFGHQMMAQALGGKVERSEKGWGVGIATSHLSTEEKAKQPWLQKLKPDFSLVVSHQDQVSQLPPDSTTLASSDFCPVGMFTVGNHFLAIQGHPEFSRAYSFDLMEARRDRIPEDVISKGQASLQQMPDAELVTRWLLAFLKQPSASSRAPSSP
ncbi:gamma-glutamyl-gamma-aminobutyrate hydrolase family protein [Grimontia kaedaensis]|uniref:Gamma-glutamyl-gamma-aminobutyrate hydrolase family protein n=1 Tax=Grimontia kaedaensis TaxID=2872157 RepID=A0ABY4WY04_9GAMM|nr:gamma-glutamyl-gamma-aminobutyrate hydrolase family protein [Grimontia kaedaensis]USH03866.1 gamma-glutamyl-gamma-aminobutyrate hydrolase family protein [Grimontia kaedaensis]